MLGSFDEPDVVLDFEEPSDRKAHRAVRVSLRGKMEEERLITSGAMFMKAILDIC